MEVTLSVDIVHLILGLASRGLTIASHHMQRRRFRDKWHLVLLSMCRLLLILVYLLHAAADSSCDAKWQVRLEVTRRDFCDIAACTSGTFLFACSDQLRRVVPLVDWSKYGNAGPMNYQLCLRDVCAFGALEA